MEQLLWEVLSWFGWLIRSNIRVIGFNIVGFVLIRWWMHQQRGSSAEASFFYGPRKRILLLTAHPDDECMFFTPTILNLNQLGHEVHILCLSTGNVDGLGDVRIKELNESGQILSIPSSRIKVVDDANLPDSMTAHWAPDKVGAVVLSHCKATRFDAIVTFDVQGVSGHPNHSACYRGLKRLIRSGELGNTLGYQLCSVALCRKYLGPVDILMTAMSFPLIHFRSPSTGLATTHAAMKAHKSQYVWFRRLHVLFSRFSYTNHLDSIQL